MSAQQPAGKKGKKKSKGMTVSLTDFLQDTSPAPVTKNIDWADESEDLDGADSLTYMSSYNNKQLLSSLPTGPRASRTIEVDASKLPNEPPFTAFVGNLPYEADERMLKDFFKDLKIISVRLPEENGRFKGYGYVEFEDKHSLYNALQHNDETFNKRQIRVDVAGSKNQDRGQTRNRNYGGYGGFNFNDGPDVTEGDWRKKPDEDSRPPQSDRDRGYYESDRRYSYRRYDHYRDRGRDYYGSSRRDYEDRRHDEGHRNDYSYGRDDRSYDGGSRGYNRDRYGSDRDRGYGRDRDTYDERERGYDADKDRGYGGDRDRGYGGDRDRGYGGDRDRGYGGDRDRGYGGDRDRGYGGDRDHGYDRDRGYGGGRDRGYSDRDYGGGRSYGSDRGYGGGRSSYSYRGSDRGYSDRGGDRYRSGQYEDGGYGRDYGRNTHSGADDYGNRRSDDQRHNSGERDRRHSAEPEEPVERPRLQLQPRTKPLDSDKNAGSGRSAAIFGNAKPVDTASREKQIEEKLQQETERLVHGKDERRDNWPKRSSRRSSERSDDGQYFQSSPRRASQKSHEDDELHRRRSTSPGQRSDSDPKGRGQKEYKPAPTPTQNPWNKKSPGEHPGEGGRKVHSRTSTSEDEANTKKPDMRPAPPPSTNSWSRGPPRLDARGEREEAEGGDSREDDMSERTPEGADDQDLYRRSDDGGDGSEQGKGDSDPGNQADDRSRDYGEQKQRRHGDGQKDEVSGRGPRRQQSYENRSDYQNGGRRRGDGGSGRRREPAWSAGHDDGSKSHGRNEGQYSHDRDNRKYYEGRDRDNVNHARNEPVRSKSGQDKRRDSSRDSRPECDRSAAAGQEQDFKGGHKGGKGGRPRGPPELEPEPVVEFVQKSKFSALMIEDDDDEDDNQDLPLEDDVISPNKVDG